MQSVKWVTFGISNALTRTIVHFFPSEGGVTAPYPASCALRVFGQGVQEKKVVIEGARLSHPDGVRAEDAFPALKLDQVGIFGLEIEVATIQPRVDIDSSGCIVELASKGHSAKFWPKRMIVLPPTNAHLVPRSSSTQTSSASTEGEVRPEPTVTPLIKDSFNTSSIVVVNGGSESYRPSLCIVKSNELGKGGAAGRPEASELPIQSLLPATASETALEEDFFSSVSPTETGWGLMRTRTLLARDTSSVQPRAAFVVYRDALTRRPVSVVAL